MTSDRAAKQSRFRKLIPLIAFLLSACGGGGGSTQSPIYVDINQQAKIDSSSAEGYLYGLRLWFSTTLTETVTSLFIDGTLTFQTGNINLTVQNLCGGSVTISGTLDETAASGTLTLNLSNYQACAWNYTYAFSGSIDLTIYNTEEYAPAGNITIPSAFLLSMNNLMIALASESFQLDGTIEYAHDMSDPDFDTIALTKNYTLSNSLGAFTYTNFTYKQHYTNKGRVSPSGYTSVSCTGRMYDSDSGYVDVATVNAAAMCEAGGAGVCPLDMTNVGRIELVGDSSTALIQFGSNLDNISIDADGNGTYEQQIQCNFDGCL